MEIFKRLVTTELPNKGMGVVTMERISKGETIARWFPHDKRTIDCVFESMDTFEVELEAIDNACERDVLLNHSWPTPEGKVAALARDAVFGAINHSSPPTVLHEFSESVWTTTANVDLDIGDELCFDYNLGSKYEVRNDDVMLRFLALCDGYDVQRRPSLGMTRPPCRVLQETLLRAKPLTSLMPPRKDGATDCKVWV